MSGATLEIVACAGLATVQDAGRPGRMHEGIPPGGALVPELLAAANLAVGNPPGAAAVELFGKLRVRAHGAHAMTLSLDGAPARPLAPGEVLDVASGPAARVGYLAVGGGIDVPLVLGGRGTLLVAGLGGHQGRALRRGDRLAAGAIGSAAASAARFDLRLDDPIRIVPGPDLERFARDAVAALVSPSPAARLAIGPLGDRVGVRLVGPGDPPWRPLAAAVTISAPMTRGSIQVTPSGELLVLGPDHPTTGGYPVIAVIVSADVGRLLARRPGAPVQLGYASLPA